MCGVSCRLGTFVFVCGNGVLKNALAVKTKNGFGMERQMIADLHCDTISKLRDYRLERDRTEKNQMSRSEKNGLFRNEFHLDLQRMKQADYLLQNFAIYIDSEVDTDVFGAYREMYGLFQEEMKKNADIIRQVVCFSDIEENRKAGWISAMLTVEEGQAADSLERLEELFRDGVRLITLTWNHRNALGCPNCILPDGTHSLTQPNTKEGLTEYGFQAIARMEEMGMMIDVSHLSDRGFYDVYENTTKPFLASHSNARAVTPHVRNLTDDMIRKLAERGGIIGVNFETTFLGAENDCGISAVVRHLEHLRNTGGEECLALGSDFDGIKGNPELRGVQNMEHLREALQRTGWKPGTLDKLFYKNVLRFYREILPE